MIDLRNLFLVSTDGLGSNFAHLIQLVESMFGRS